jgi:hypothetical protein
MTELLNTMRAAYPHLKEINNPKMFMAVIFTIIDQYAADHDISPKEIMELTQNACKAQIEAFETLGTMEKSI